MFRYHFDDVFVVHGLDKNGNVSRIEAHGEQTNMHMELDVATHLYPINVGERFTVVLVPIPNLDGTPYNSFDDEEKDTLIDDYEYVMSKKLYCLSEDDSDPENVKLEMYALFRGLLVTLKGEHIKDPTAEPFELDQMLFLLMRKK